MYSKIISKYIFPAWTRLKHAELDEYYEHFEETQWWSRENLKEYQNQKLRKLVKHAYDNVPYYRKLFRREKLLPSDIRKLEDMGKIPITNKSTMKQKFSSREVLADNYEEFFPKICHSSGSTGSPIKHLRGQNCTIISEALMQRYYRWMKVEKGHNQVLLWAHPYKINWIDTKRHHFKRFLRGIKEFHTHGWSRKDFIKCMNHIRRIKPEMLRGYSPYIYLLARIAKELKVDDIHTKSISTTAQTLYQPQRKLIEEQFESEVFDQYGGSESLISACECEEHYGYHVMDEHVIIELIADEKLPPKTQKIVITDLDNWAQPFIRYENGDLGESLNNYHCKCGRGLSMIKSIRGRTQDIIVSDDERYFTLHPFTSLFYNFEGIDHFQIIQKSKKYIVINIVKNNSLLKQDVMFIKDKLDNFLQDSLNYSIEFVDTIPINESGKHKILISKVNNL